MRKLLNSIMFLSVLAVISLTCKNTGRSGISKDNPLIPSWSMESVWYEIFPERFRNGDSANDPVFSDLLGAWPHEQVLPWQAHPWTSDWYELQPYELENGEDLWFNIARRRYGGDIQGILDRLDYLKDLGVGVIQLAPVFMSPSAHKLDATCMHHIDPSFGPDPERDKQIIDAEIPDDHTTWKWTSADSLMRVLIAEAHKRKIKIVLEASFNHLGSTSFAFQDVLVNQQNSRFRDWFYIRSFKDDARGTLLEYKGWNGLQEYPELRRDDNGMDPGVRQYLYDVTRRWMDPLNNGDPSQGIDGWIMVDADGNSVVFWNEWTKFARSINPEVYLGAETMTDQTGNLLTFMQKTGFSGLVSYPYMFIASQYFFKGRHIFNAGQMDSVLRQYRGTYPWDMILASQMVLGNVKTDRVGSRSVNRRVFDFLKHERYLSETRATNNWYKTEKPKRKDLEIVRQMVIYQMTSPGIPLVYYGDEVAMWGAGDPCNRKPMLWDDLYYSPEQYQPNGMKRRNPGQVVASKDMLDHYRKLIRIRNAFMALQAGDYQPILTDSSKEIIGYSRTFDRQTVYVVLNNSYERQTVIIPVASDGIYINALEDNTEVLAEHQQIQLQIRGNWGAILTPRPAK